MAGRNGTCLQGTWDTVVVNRKVATATGLKIETAQAEVASG
jgi:hypothetical protein